jgi:predicted dehydrogenase
MNARQRRVRVGVVGLSRGRAFLRYAEAAGATVVAVCDRAETRARDLAQHIGARPHSVYETLLEEDIEAVILANDFHQHASLAIKALAAGKHVLSELTACFTPAEGVALVRSVERTGLIYMLAENTPYMSYNLELRRLYTEGRIGEFRYGEGEYVHPLGADDWNRISPGVTHWRNWIPATYYCEHSLGPLMFITNTNPVKVNGFVVPHDRGDLEMQKTARVHDTAAMIALRMDNGAVAKLLHCDLRGTGPWWTRIHGNRGLMENLRTGDILRVRVKKEPWDRDSEEPEEVIYLPESELEESAREVKHGAADLNMFREFVQAVREERQPYFDVYRGVTMSLVGILAYRSALADSKPVEIPDFRVEDARRNYEQDDWSPDPAARREGQPWPSILGRLEPTHEGLDHARRVWEQMTVPPGDAG